MFKTVSGVIKLKSGICGKNGILSCGNFSLSAHLLSLSKISVILLLFLAATVSTAAATADLDYMKVDININNGYVITTVEQKLTNNEDEADYDDFSIYKPEEAFISDFTLLINDKEYSSEVLPKGKAEKSMMEAVSQGKSAGLLTDEKGGRFEYAVNIQAGQSIIVRLTYEQALKKTLGEYEYVQPLYVQHDLDDLSVNVNIVSENKIISLETPGFNNTKISSLSNTEKRIYYRSDSIPNRDMKIVFSTESPELTGDMLFYETGGQGYMMHVFSPTVDQLGTPAMNKDIIFVIDKSRSMEGKKIEQVKSVFSEIISDLPEEDRFSIIFFDNRIMEFSDELMMASSDNKKDAIDFVNNLDASGRTDIDGALVKALEMFDENSDSVPIVVFLTDGIPTSGVKNTDNIRNDISNENDAQAAIFTVAFGIDKDEGYYDFLKVLSLENYGKADSFSISDDSMDDISNFYDTISTPLMTDIEYDYDGEVTGIVNTGESSLFAGSDAIVLGKYASGTGSISSTITGSTRSGTQEFSNNFVVRSSSSNSFIPRLWAYEKIMNLLDRIDVEGEKAEMVEEVTDLSMEFGFATPYTSLYVEMPEEEEPEPAAPPAEYEAVAEEVEEEEEAVQETMVEEIPLVEDETVMAESDDVEENTDKEETPGFEIVYAIIGVFAAAYCKCPGFSKK
ncbi:MAG: hypothetical protein PWQ75_333 [Methanolobus sp.]|nr:hypothetical protein [Methanolobus sp.]